MLRKNINKNITIRTAFALALLLTVSIPLAPDAYGQSYKAEQALKRATEFFDEKKYKESERWYKKAAKMGHVGAQNFLGNLYSQGIEGSIPQNHKKAVEWWLKAAKKDSAKAQTSLSYAYYEGLGVKQDYKKAAKWVIKAAEQGYDEAQRNIGFLYFKGQGVEQDYKKAVAWYRKAAEQGNIRAQGALARMYEKGEGVEKNCGKAAHWRDKAIGDKETVHADSLYDWAGGYEEGEACPDPERAAALLGVAAAKGHAKAKEKLETLAKQGNIKAQYMLAKVYSKGENTKDYAQAAEWYRKAGEQGHADALYELGILYDEGRGVKKNGKRAVDLLHKAAKRGNVDSQFFMGFSLQRKYERETGDIRDYKKAAEWYRKAAEQGDNGGLWKLGNIYYEGEIVKKDIILAGALLKMSFSRGNAFAEFTMESIQAELTTEQKNEVEKTIQEWEERIKANKKK